MPLFQKSVLNKYLNEQDKTAVEKAYNIYYNYFHNPEIQRNIYASKEEQFQEGFLRELFVKVFGFVLNPNPDFNLTTEFKNEKGAKKADGAILKEGKAIAVIELKSTKTKDLESIRQQAFDYKANQSECVYVITSNFQKLRFYINNAVEFEEFDLFALSKERFEVLHLCLNNQNLLTNLALKIKNASLLEEENITKKFYADYSLFKKELFEDIAARNVDLENISKLQLYKKTQKLLDRFLFIFFAEDRGLLPPNSISRMIKRWNVLNDEDAYKPLYKIYKQYFGYLNTGRPGKVSADEIHAYNGGLFLPDEILDEIEIDDAILLKHTSTLTNYDFDSQVDVNILGHIFEHSLNEIETTTAELEGVDFDKQKSKRKKDGVFYTPKYITKYIVDNTVGKLCEEKKTELRIKDDEFAPNRKKETKKKLLASLEAYRKWLLELTICDPACGSGAFLNQALEYLINEHHYIDGLNAQLFGSAMVFQDVENQILENNIFGVDINEESVDIARLSLWLRTAQRGRKLTTLNKNIKCGNSLIDDPEVAGDKAFNWEKEFPAVFERGGFDVVIGNPPYVNIVNIEDENYRKRLQKTFSTFKNKCDLYSLFIEKSITIAKFEGELGFIFPNSWMGTSSFIPFRKHISENTKINTLVELPPGVFDDAVVTTVIMTMRYSKPSEKHEIELLYPTNQIIKKRNNTIKLLDILKTTHYAFSFEQKLELKSSGIKLSNIVSFSLGIKTSNDKRFIFDYKIDDHSLPMIRGKNIRKYFSEFGGEYLWYMPELIKEKTGGRPRVLENFLRPKILIQDIAKSINATYDDSNYLVNDTINVIYDTVDGYTMYFVLGLLNSKAVNKWFSTTFSEGLHIKLNQLQEIPIPNASVEQKEMITKLVIDLLSTNGELYKLNSVFFKYLGSQFPQTTLAKKLLFWHELEFGEFIKELNKAIKKVGGKKLTKMDEMEWMEVFETKKAEAQTLKTEIDKTDKEIDRMVYELYGLSEEEIGIVEMK